MLENEGEYIFLEILIQILHKHAFGLIIRPAGVQAFGGRAPQSVSPKTKHG